ncbi:MAG: hypothetical protein KKG59_00935 [Nanoarchaeota archaeon]|nr:hypothetical protein [Nanoarchaeota archaeon]
MKEKFIFVLLAVAVLVFNMVFVADNGQFGITGRTITTVNITEAIQANCIFNVPSGWNLISFYCIGTQDAPVNIVGNLTNMVGIFRFHPGGGTDKWKSYNPNLPSWVVNDLTSMSKKDGYWIRMGSSQVFSYFGVLSDNNTITLAEGWNLIGYPSPNSMAVNTTFGDVFGSYTHAEAYNRTVDQWLRFDPNSNNNTLNFTRPFMGFWINMTATGSIDIS